jgi:hypothetical protein
MEEDLLEFWYEFRLGRGAHDALMRSVSAPFDKRKAGVREVEGPLPKRLALPKKGSEGAFS